MSRHAPYILTVLIFVVGPHFSHANPEDLLDQAVEENAGRRTLPVGASVAEAAEVEQLVQRADRLLDAREFVEAVRLYEEAYRRAPDNQDHFARLLVARRAAGLMTAADRDALALIEEQQRATVASLFRDIRLAVIQGRQALAAGDVALAESRAASAMASLDSLPPDVDAAPYVQQVHALRKAVARDRGRANPTAAVDARAAAAGARDESLWLTDMGAPNADNTTRIRVTTAGRDDATEIAIDPDDGDIINVDELLAAQQSRLVYDRDLDRALREARAGVLLTATEAALPPSTQGDMTFPADWPDRTARRSQYRTGIIYRGADFSGPDGQTYYSAIYDLGDLVHPVPNFYGDYPGTSRRQRIEDDDRFWLQYRSQIFNGYADDLAAGLPLLHFFGGINNDAVSTRTDPRETERVVRTIERFLNGR